MSIPLVLLFLGLSMTTANAVHSKTSVQTGTASWYGSECSKTAGGEHYNPNALTAAHRTLPLGTIVEVRNKNNGRAVKVRIKDRGPYCKGRIIDVSKAAAQQLQMIHSGTAPVDVVVLK